MISADQLRMKVRRIFESHGVADAEIVADHLVEQDLRGVHSHGVIRVPTYVESLKNGRMNPRPRFKIVEDSGGQVVADGDNGMGHAAAFRANELAMARAREHGMAGVALRGSNHCGALAYYPIRSRAAGLIGLATTNAGINMTPTGGTKKLVGNNPVAIAIPTNREWPMVLDMATSVVAGGKLDVARMKGESIPLGWARDVDGSPTTDPVAARGGSLDPMGGPKGYGLALMLDVLAGVLSGGRFGAGLGRPGSAQFFLAIDVTRYQPLDEFKARMDQLIDQLHECPRAPGVDRIYVAGEIEWEMQTKRQREGLPLEPAVLDALEKAA